MKKMENKLVSFSPELAVLDRLFGTELSARARRFMSINRIRLHSFPEAELQMQIP